MRMLGGRYRLVERRGAGGMAVVWRARDDVLSRDVAVKLLAPELVADQAARDRIHAEARAAGGLAHPNITSVFDFGISTDPDGQYVPYLVMELLDGDTLANRLRAGPLPWREALRVCADIAAALAAAHASGVIHRDVKPANVMITSRGVKVLDFGIAAAVGESDDIRPDEPFLGTLAYMAPERLLGETAVPATDVYALGLITYRCLTGLFPWQPQTTEELVSQHCYSPPAPLPEISGLPGPAAQLISRCLAKSPADRPSSAEVARAFGAAAGHQVFLLTDDPASPASASIAPVADWPADPPSGDWPDDPPSLRDADRVGVRTATPSGGVDDVAPRSPVPPPAGTGSGTARRGASAGRLAAAGLGLAGVLALAVTCAARTPHDAGRPAGAGFASGSTPAPTAVSANGPACAVSYQMMRGTAEARITIHNTGRTNFAEPTLVVGLGGEAAGAETEPAVRIQLRAQVAKVLPTGTSITVRLRDNYLIRREPEGFALNDVPCSVNSTAPERTTAGDNPTGPAEPTIQATPEQTVPNNGATPGPTTIAPQPPTAVATKTKDANSPRTRSVPTPTKTKKTKAPAT